MPREFRVKTGERVMTPHGPATLTGTGYGRDGFLCHVLFVGGETRSMPFDSLSPLPRDIPREHVEMLHAAVAKRLGQLEASQMVHDGEGLTRAADVDTACHAELAEVAEALRVLLEGEVRDGE